MLCDANSDPPVHTQPAAACANVRERMSASPCPPIVSRSASTRTTHDSNVQAFSLTSLPGALRYTTSAVLRSFHCNAALAFLPCRPMNTALEAAGRADYDRSSTEDRGRRGYGVCAGLRSQRRHSRPVAPRHAAIAAPAAAQLAFPADKRTPSPHHASGAGSPIPVGLPWRALGQPIRMEPQNASYHIPLSATALTPVAENERRAATAKRRCTMPADFCCPVAGAVRILTWEETLAEAAIFSVAAGILGMRKPERSRSFVR